MARSAVQLAWIAAAVLAACEGVVPEPCRFEDSVRKGEQCGHKPVVLDKSDLQSMTQVAATTLDGPPVSGACTCGEDPKLHCSPTLAGVKVAAFYLDRHETTVAEYRGCVASGSCTPPSWTATGCCVYGSMLATKELLPVNCVAPEQASQYCKWRGKRLATRGEWQAAYLATYGNGTQPFGFTCTNTMFGDCAASDCDQSRVPEPAAGNRCLPDAAKGLCDLAGNLREWTEEPGAADKRYFSHGGSFKDDLGALRRYCEFDATEPNLQTGHLTGIRCAATWPPAE